MTSTKNEPHRISSRNAWYLSFAFGVVGAICFKLRDRGIIDSQFLLLGPAGAILSATFIFAKRLRDSRSPSAFVENFFYGALLGGAAFLVSFFTWFVATQMMPDFAGVYEDPDETSDPCLVTALPATEK